MLLVLSGKCLQASRTDHLTPEGSTGEDTLTFTSTISPYRNISSAIKDIQIVCVV